MKFEIDITDAAHLAGITASREAYNDVLPRKFEMVEVAPAQPPIAGDAGVPAVMERREVTPRPGTLATDAEYVQMVMASAAESYSKQRRT